MKKENDNKTELIRLFAESMDKHLETRQDVANLIEAIGEFNNFMDKQKQFKHEIILNIRSIKEFVLEVCASEEIIDDLYTITDEFVAGMILAEKFKKEGDMLFEILDDTNCRQG